MEYINPLFNNTEIIKKPKSPTVIKNLKPTTRATRSDKKHNVKFPVSPVVQLKLRSYCRQADLLHRKKTGEPLKQTKFNSMMLQFGLQHENILQWHHSYQDTKVYMHTNILETEYQEIGGPHGLSVRKNLSDRKVVFHIILSVLKWLEGEGSLEKVIF